MTSLYKLTSNFIEVDNLIEEYLEAGQDDLAENLVKANEIIVREIQNKSVGFIHMFRNIDSKVDAIDGEIKRLQELKKQTKKKEENLKEILKSCMETLGTKKLETDLGNITIRNNPGSLVIDNEELIPKLYKQEIVTVETKIDKAALKKNIKAGIDIEGCHLEVGTSLSIPKTKKESK